MDAQVFGVGGLPRRPVSAGASLPITVRLKNAGTVRLDARFREEGSGREAASDTVRLEPVLFGGDGRVSEMRRLP